MALVTRTGKIAMLRVHRRGSGFGPPADRIEGELVVKLEPFATEAYGVTLRDDADGPTHRAMFDLLRGAFEAGREVTLEVELDAGRRNGEILRTSSRPAPPRPVTPVVVDPFGGLVVGPLAPT